MSVRFYSLSLSIQRPEGILKKIVRVIQLFDLAKPVPVRTKACFDTLRRLMATKEL